MSTDKAPSQEPVAWMLIDDTGMKWVSVLRESSAYDIHLYTHPSNAAAQIAEITKQRDDLLAALEEVKQNAGSPECVYQITKAAIDAALKLSHGDKGEIK